MGGLHLSLERRRDRSASWSSALGADKTFTIRDAARRKGRREQAWHYPSRAECMVCHSRAAGFVLGLNTLQMNKQHDYGGVLANQLRTLDHLGVLRVNSSWRRNAKEDRRPAAKPACSQEPEEYPALPNPYDESAGLEQRVRSYLHSNCAQCHVAAGGGNAAMELGFTTTRDKTNLIGVRPLHDKFGIENARLIAPGAPERSVLLKRMALRGRGQMPPLATSVVDEAGGEALSGVDCQLTAGIVNESCNLPRHSYLRQPASAPPCSAPETDYNGCSKYRQIPRMRVRGNHCAGLSPAHRGAGSATGPGYLQAPARQLTLTQD